MTLKSCPFFYLKKNTPKKSESTFWGSSFNLAFCLINAILKKNFIFIYNLNFQEMDTTNLFFLVILPVLSFIVLSLEDIKKQYKESKEQEILFFLCLFFIVKIILLFLIFPFIYIREIFVFFYIILILYFTKTEWGRIGLFFGVILSISFWYIFDIFKNANLLNKILFLGIDVFVLLFIIVFYFVAYFLYKKYYFYRINIKKIN
jgi:hypothetical protein